MKQNKSLLINIGIALSLRLVSRQVGGGGGGGGGFHGGGFGGGFRGGGLAGGGFRGGAFAAQHVGGGAVNRGGGVGFGSPRFGGVRSAPYMYRGTHFAARSSADQPVHSDTTTEATARLLLGHTNSADGETNR